VEKLSHEIILGSARPNDSVTSVYG
jgi:hypothetical protein